MFNKMALSVIHILPGYVRHNVYSTLLRSVIS